MNFGVESQAAKLSVLIVRLFKPSADLAYSYIGTAIDYNESQ